MKPAKVVLLACLLAGTLLTAQDTLSFGGIRTADLPAAEVRALLEPVSPLAATFSIEEVRRLPGTFYDPARLVALLPGTVQTNDQANHLSVRGNTPNANLWRLNGLAIVNPNHTANAGTLFDLPTLSGGGVNAISAQILNNSAFLSSGLPARYGFATGGTFDLRLRPGDKREFRPQIQAGVIGIDGAAEGPIGKQGRTSYLINGRYSFTGLLGAAGIDFGGEEISFWDVNASLDHVTGWGKIAVFGIIGGSHNDFTPPEDELDIEEEKDWFKIQFEDRLYVGGVTVDASLGQGVLSGGLAYSSTEPERKQREFAGRLNGRNASSRYQLTNNRLSAHLRYEIGALTAGYELLTDRVDLTIGESTVTNSGQTTEEAEITGHAPFVNYELGAGRWTIDLGLRASIYSGSFGESPSGRRGVNEIIPEPRLRIQRRWNDQRLVLNAERLSAPPLSSLLRLSEVPAEVLVPQTTQLSLSYGRQIGRINVRLTPFYQWTPEDYAFRSGLEIDGVTTVSANSFHEINPNYTFNTVTATRRYGLELEAAGGRLPKGWYYRGNVTLLRAETEQPDGSYARDRYDVGFITKVTLGREWTANDYADRKRTLGFNLALIAHGGERYGAVQQVLPANGLAPFTPYFLDRGFTNELGVYFRPDLRLYKTKVRTKTVTTLALDLQNAAGIENLNSRYYDRFTLQNEDRTSLGLIPVLSYRIEW